MVRRTIFVQGLVAAVLLLLAVAAPAGAASADPASIDFGAVPVNTTVSRDVSLTVDAGYEVAAASGEGINPPFDFDFDTCSAFTGPGVCNVKERFTPTATGPAAGTLHVFACPTAGVGSCIDGAEQAHRVDYAGRRRQPPE